MPYVQFTPFSGPSDPLYSILSALSEPATQGSKTQGKSQCKPGTGSCQPRRAVYKHIINPRFDVSELADAYVLEGELPGVSDKKSITIEFDDAQTIAIKGEVKRQSKVAAEEPQQHLTEAALQASAAQTENKKSSAAPEETVVYVDEPESKRHSVTVEDVVDESESISSNDDFEILDGPTASKADKGKKRAPEDVEMTDKPAEKPAEPTAQAPSKPQQRYWISERSVGVFERRFKFQGLIDQEAVKATLENGLLTIVIPKRQPVVRQVRVE